MGKGNKKDQGTEESPDLNKVIFDVKVIIMPFLEASNEALKWSVDMGIPPLRTPESLELRFDADLSKYSNYEIGELMNKAKEIKAFYGRVMAEITNRVRDRQRALRTTKKVIKKLLLQSGFKGTATALSDEVDIDPRVIKGEQVLTKAEDKLEIVANHFKSISGTYETLSRNVTLIADENETFRRVDRVEGMRKGGYQPGGPQSRGRRADRVSQQTIKGTDE